MRPGRGEDFDFNDDPVLSLLASDDTPEARFEWDRQCHCGSATKAHIRGGYSGCEYWNHHCDSCHEAMACTLVVCGFAAAPPPAVREASVDYFIGPEAYNATVGVFCGWLRSRGHGDIADALACTAPEVLAGFAHADRSSRGGAP